MTLSREARQHWLNTLIRNSNMYEKFLEFAKTKSIDDSVIFLHEFRTVPWNGNTPIGVVHDDTIYQLYVSDLGPNHVNSARAHMVNLAGETINPIDKARKQQQPVNWGPAVLEIENLLLAQIPNPIDQYVEKLLGY